MPLRDHFRPPLADRRPWDGLHGQWPAMIVMGLNRTLPERYVAEPQVHLGSSAEIDVATYEEERPSSYGGGRVETHGVATALWTPPEPTLAAATGLSDLDEYGVRIFDTQSGRRLVAAVEIVSPANKDRPVHRRAFVARCAAMLQKRVCVVIVDLVTNWAFNLYEELLSFLDQTDTSLGDTTPPLYTVSCRWGNLDDASMLEAWMHPMAVGQRLPTLPLWLAPDLAVPLDLEQTYEETCRVLRIR
jgi:hypothetical protein